MPYFIAIHDGEERLQSVWYISADNARPEVAGVDETHEIQANLAVDFEDEGLTEQRSARTLPPIVLADGSTRPQTWLDRLAYTSRGAHRLTSFVTGPHETDLRSPQAVLKALQDGSLVPDEVVVPSGWEDGQP